MDLCTSVISCIYNFQTLIAGILTIVAAVVTGVVIWKTAYLPIKHKKEEDQDRKDRKLKFVALVLSRNLETLSTRAKQAIGTVKVTKASNTSVNEEVKKRATLLIDPIIEDWDLVSLFPKDIIANIADLRKIINEHNFDIERAGGAFGDDNFGQRIVKRAEAISTRGIVLSRELVAYSNQVSSDLESEKHC